MATDYYTSALPEEEEGDNVDLALSVDEDDDLFNGYGEGWQEDLKRRALED